MRKTVFILVAIAIAVIFSSCEDKITNGTVTLNFDHKVGTEDLVFDDIKYPAKSGHTYSVATLKYYISNITLNQSGGSGLTFDDVHYRDAKEASTRQLELGDIPNGEYTSISFTFGLDETANVDAGLENTQTNINMEWPIPGDQGYHYMKFEGKYDSLNTATIKNFNIHTGATMGNQNFVTVTVPASDISVDGENWTISVVMDLNEWLQNPTTFDFETYGPMIMMNQAAQEVVQANGQTVFSIGEMDSAE
ncbi:hypothetical protein N9933_02700 [bacterium]|nr:hypothetical protein [bacterium]